MRACVAIAIGLAACSGPRREEAAAPVAMPVPVSVPAIDAAVAADAAPVDPKAARIELTFVGDLMFGGYFDDHYDPQYPEKHDPLVEMDAALASDLVIGNLETTIARALPAGGGPHDGKGHKRFVTLPERVAVIARHGIRTVSLANNHQLDNDAAGLVDTPAILGELGIAYVGGARTEEPRFRVETVVAKGWRIGLISVTTQMNRSPGKALVPYVRDTGLRAAVVPVVTAARADHDLVIVLVHWGYEYQDAPARWQIEAAHAFVEAGADAVIGHHPHVWQAIERAGGAVIAYSLGNFVFPNGKERVRDTGVLRLGFARAEGARSCLDRAVVHPARQQRGAITRPTVPDAKARAEIAARWFALSAARRTRWVAEGDHFTTEAACPR